MPAKKPAAGDLTNGNEPISVADAFGIPSNWSLPNALGNAPLPSEPAAPAAPAEPAAPETPSEPAAPADPTPNEPATPPEAEMKPAAAPAKPAVVKSEPKPATPAEPKPAPAQAPVVPPVPPKIKIGGKEYTEEELAALVAKPAAPANPTPPPAEEPKPRTAEEIAAERAELKKKDTEWVSATAQHVDINLDEKSVDTILAGGPEAVAAMTNLLKTSVAQAILMSRKSLLNDLDPVLKGIRDQQQPIIERYHREESDRAWSDFTKAHPDLADFRDIVETIGKAMVESNSPALAEVKSMEDFGRVVGEEARRYISRFKPAVPANEPPAAPPAQPPTTPAAPAAPAKAKVKPPGSNLPTPQASSGNRNRDSVASLLPS